MTLTDSLYSFFRSCPYIKNRLNINRFDAALPNFSINFLPEIKIVRQYTDGSTIEEIAFNLVCNRHFNTNSSANSDNSSLFENIANWLEEQNQLGNLPSFALRISAVSFPSISEGISTIASARYSMKCVLWRRRNA